MKREILFKNTAKKISEENVAGPIP